MGWNTKNQEPRTKNNATKRPQAILSRCGLLVIL